MKYINTLVFVLIAVRLQAQIPDFSLFLGIRDEKVKIFENAVGNKVVAEIIEESSTDDWNVIVIRGKSTLRFYADIYTDIYTKPDKVIRGWIDKTACAVYANPHGEYWHLYENPSIDSNSISFQASIIMEYGPFLYVMDYIIKAYRGCYPEWIKVGFMYRNVYYEGWINEFCTDINHSCH